RRRLASLRKEPDTGNADEGGNERGSRGFGHGGRSDVQISRIEIKCVEQVSHGAVRGGLAQNSYPIAVIDLSGDSGIGVERPDGTGFAGRIPKKCAEWRERVGISVAGKDGRESVPGDSHFAPAVVAQQIEFKAAGGDSVET